MTIYYDSLSLIVKEKLSEPLVLIVVELFIILQIPKNNDLRKKSGGRG
jgi:hypothetical protein